jgi:predicted ATP-dependent endonuclease of OLD family
MTAIDSFRQAAIEWAIRGDAGAKATATRLRGSVDTVILVEGVSDAAAIEALATRTGQDLEDARVCVIPMGGVTNIAKFLGILGDGDGDGLGIRVAGLCDANEERYFLRALAGTSATAIDSRHDMAEVGFFVCVDDLEDEFIRALGVEAVQDVMDAHGDLRLFRTFQNQPAQRERSLERQLRRFFGTTSGRKERYAKILVERCELGSIPQPLADILRFVR